MTAPTPHDLVTDLIVQLMSEGQMDWHEAALLLIEHGIDALHINPGQGGTKAGLIEALVLVNEALAELDRPCEAGAVPMAH